MAAALKESEAMKAFRGLVRGKEYLFEQAETMRSWCSSRFTTDRWLDENEREWYALDRVVRSRPWATKKDVAFRYPFREATDAMREAEGKWIGDDFPMPPDTRGEAPCDVVVQVQSTPTFPPDHRVLLFAPEFGSHASFDMESWSFMEPEEKVDFWVVSWQGWTDWDSMLEQVTRRVLSFADGANTVWFGQGAGALVAYEVLKRIERGIQTPNLPVGLVLADCPAPHEFASVYRPSRLGHWSQLLAAPSVTEARRRRIDADLRTIGSYKFQHSDARGLLVPVTAVRHSGDALAAGSAVEAWSSYAPSGKFELVDLGEAEDLDEYLQGTRYTLNADPQVLSTISSMCQKYDRWATEEWPDLGDLNGPLPDEVDCVIVGAGIGGLCQADRLAASGSSVVCVDRYHEVGGVWNYFGNDYSRVNTSEIGYRIVCREGLYERVNEDHSPRRDIMRDMYVVATRHCKDRIRCNVEVLSIDRQPDESLFVRTRHVKTGVEKTIRTKGVSMHVNRRIGKCRLVDWENSDSFRGDIFYGYGNTMKNVSYWGKKVLVVGAGAFAFENVRTAVEHGARHVTLLGRRDGTTCPKWIDMISFLRPLDKNLMTHRSGNMISFECWQNCYKDAGLKLPGCWEEGLLKPNNHTISVSDLAFIAGFHGMFKLQVGEIARFRDDGMGVDLKDGSTIDCNMIVKCTGFHLNDEVPKLTGTLKMQPYGLLGFNLNYGAEPLLDGGQFGASKDKTEVELDYGDITQDEYLKGIEVVKEHGFSLKHIEPHGNPFGSGQGGPIVYQSNFFAWLMSHPEEQQALLKLSGKAPQDVVNLWSSQIGEYQNLILVRLLASIGRAALQSEAQAH